MIDIKYYIIVSVMAVACGVSLFIKNDTIIINAVGVFIIYYLSEILKELRSK